MKFVNYFIFLVLIVTIATSSLIPGKEKAWADSLLKTIEVDNYPSRVVYNPVNNNIYVIHGDSSVSNNISVIDSSTNEVIDTIFGQDGTLWISYVPSNNDMYVGNLDSNDIDYISIIDSTSNTVSQTIPIGEEPHKLEFNPSNNYAYIPAFFSHSVSVIETDPDTTIVPPTATTITSSRDSNGNTVQNKSSTASTSITFKVTATEGTNDIAGFECSLDNSAFSSCSTSNPATIKYDNLATDRKHTFQVRAVDIKGNTDPVPAVFEWTVLTPSQAIAKLKGTINEMHLSKGTTTSLQALLNSALKQLDNNSKNEACGPLRAFLNQVNEKRSSGQLTSTQAADLRQQATAIQKQIGCTTTGASAAYSNTNSESNSPLENMVDSAFSNLSPMQSEQIYNARDKIHKGLDLYGDFLGNR